MQKASEISRDINLLNLYIPEVLFEMTLSHWYSLLRQAFKNLPFYNLHFGLF